MTTPTPVVQKLGPGILTIGETASLSNWSAQITKCEVAPDVEVGDATNVLSGAVLPGDRDYTAKLSGTINQDLSTSGLVPWSWTNRGKELPFLFVPTRAGSAAASVNVKGRLIVDPLKIGGDVKERMTSDFEFECVGFPVIGAGES